MNKSQKVVLAIFVPIIIFSASFILAYYASSTYDVNILETVYNPFKLEKTWYIWGFALLASCLFDYVLLENDEEVKKGNNKKVSEELK